MRVVHQWVLAQIYDRVVSAGYADLGRAHVGMFRYPGLAGLRPTQLAELLGVTKQSVNDLLRDMERLGYLVRIPDPTDRRARIIHLTEKGEHLTEAVYDGARAAENAIAEWLGAERFAQFRSSLVEIAHHVSNGNRLAQDKSGAPPAERPQH